MKNITLVFLLSLVNIHTLHGMNATNNNPQIISKEEAFAAINPIEIITNLPPDLQLKIVAIADPEVKNILATTTTYFNGIASKKNHVKIFAHNSLWLGKKDEAFFMRYYASEPKGLPVIKALLNSGIHPNPKDRILNMSPLEIARQHGHTDIVELLEKSYPEGETPVIDESKQIPSDVMDLYKGKKEIAERLIKKEIDYHYLAHPTINSTFITCLAAYLGHMEIISYFMKECPFAFITIEVGTSTGNKKSYAPNYAAQGGYKNILIELSSYYKNKDYWTTNFGLTIYAPIHWACSTGSNKAIIWLIENGAKQSKPTKEKDTPLHIAARYNQPHTVKLLLEKYKCDKKEKNLADQTPLDIATERNYTEIVELLTDHTS
jgi:ankyrin repeat protein